ncbi:MAG: uracil-DNA glycosylase [Candidatus Saccharimonadales bacterium]|nr:uracil-DNA glycosylase [Candidatus Saccharibacteria bacterium]
MVNRKQTLLDELKARIEASGITPELKSQAAQLVFGEGNPDADVLFIGEAPGKQEDLQGKPFVGASGKFLDEMLESIGMKREDIYITNIVKYRPPNNRDPLPEEKKAFLPYLQEQLEIIQPKIIVTLGRHSGGAFLPDLHISQDHGKPKRIRVKRQEIRDKNSQSGGTMELVIVPLYHPAAALYNGGMRQTLMDDFALIPEILKKVN